MMALYGTQSRFQAEVMAKGVTRSSAAAFLLPDSPERQRVLLTFACSIYHAIGIDILGQAIQGGQSLGSVLEAQGEEVCLILMKSVVAMPWKTANYVLTEGETYPYVKIVHSGPLNTPDKTLLRVPSRLLDGRIDGYGTEGSLRFFQKNDGTLQKLEGCNMAALKEMCVKAAYWALSAHSDLLIEERDLR